MNINYRTYIIHSAACLAFMVVLLDVSVVNVALNVMQVSFHADMSELQWIINAYALVFSALLLSAGMLGDIFGSKPIFLTGFALFTVASLGCGLSTELRMLIACRIIQGIGAALLVPSSLSIIRNLFEDDVARSRAIGWWGASGGIALAAGPVVGGILISSLGWSSIFLLNIPLGLIGLWSVGRYAVNSSQRTRKKSFDIVGQIVAILTLAALVSGLIEASHYGWGSPLILMALCCAVLGAITFIFIELHHPDPMIPLQLFREPVLSSVTIIGLIANLTFYGMIFVLSFYFQSIRHFSPEKTGIAFLPMMGVLMLVNIISGRMIVNVGAKILTSVGLTISAIGYGLLLTVTTHSSYWLMVFPMLFAGSGIALAIPAITNATLASVHSNQAGIASGILNAARQVGGVIGVSLFGTLISGNTDNQFIHGMHVALIISVGLLLVSAWLGYVKIQSKEIQPSYSQGQ